MLITKQETNILKGIGILTVILSHTSIMCGEAGLSVPVLNNRIVYMAVCEAGMSLFLFISGYGLHKSFKTRGLEGYIRGKIINVFIPYFLVQAVSMAVGILRNGRHGSILFNISQLMGINSTNLYDPTMWYISYIFFWYAVFWLAYRIGHGSCVSLMIVGAVSLAGFYYVPWYWGNNADYCIITFFLGVLLAAVEENSNNDKGIPGISVYSKTAMCIAFAVIGYVLTIRYHRMSIWTENIGAIFGMAAFILLVNALRGRFGFRVLGFLGRISFWMYLLEWKLIIQNPVYKIWGCNYLTYCLCFAVTLIIAYFLYKSYETIKGHLIYVNQDER